MTHAPAQLPRGRHGLSRSQVVADQRMRMLLALAETMAEKGYVATTVADVLARAGVSRETFYQQFASKHDAFMAAFDTASDVLVDRVVEATPPRGRPLERFEVALGAYLETLVDQPAFARMFLVEVHAAGADAIARRADLQARLVDLLVGELGFGEANRFACELVVAAASAMVTPRLVTGDLDAIVALRTPLAAAMTRLTDEPLAIDPLAG